jgi:rhodanese-related sulfurtransferase
MEPGLDEEKLQPKRAREVIAGEGAQVLDLRDDDEWLEARIAGAVRAEDDLEGAVEALDEDRPVVVVCANGKRSARWRTTYGGGAFRPRRSSRA